MFNRAISFVVLAAALCAVASPAPSVKSSQCDTGKVQCCNSVQPAGSKGATDAMAPLGLVLGDVNTPVGLTCTPLNALGLGNGGSCASTPVCCENNSFNGVVAIGCSPLNTNL